MSRENDLRKQAEEVFGLSYFDRLKLWLAWRVIQRKVIGKMGNWRTLIFGAIAAAMNYALVVTQNGTVMPQSTHDWLMLGLSAAMTAFAFVAKDASVGSQPGDPPTKERIAGALKQGESVRPEAIGKAVEAEKIVDSLAPPTTPTGI